MLCLGLRATPIHVQLDMCSFGSQGPLFVDLMGTCHTETVKPVIMEKKHVENFYVHAERGLSFFAPEV